jgi:hypothetical protein
MSVVAVLGAVVPMPVLQAIPSEDQVVGIALSNDVAAPRLKPVLDGQIRI